MGGREKLGFVLTCSSRRYSASWPEVGLGGDVQGRNSVGGWLHLVCN